MRDRTVIRYINILLQTGKERLVLYIQMEKPRRKGHKLQAEKTELVIKKKKCFLMEKIMKAMQQTAWTGCEAPGKEHLQPFIRQTSVRKERSITETSPGRKMLYNPFCSVFLQILQLD